MKDNKEMKQKIHNILKDTKRENAYLDDICNCHNEVADNYSKTIDYKDLDDPLAEMTTSVYVHTKLYNKLPKDLFKLIGKVRHPEFPFLSFILNKWLVIGTQRKKLPNGGYLQTLSYIYNKNGWKWINR
jgi:hypothetical protein